MNLKVMVSTLQISLRWNDEYLTWNKSLFSSSIIFRPNEIWVPDVIVKNNVNNIIHSNKESLLVGSSVSIFDPNERLKYLIIVRPNGDCRWVFPMKLMSNCELNQQYFPFDTQKCNIDFGSTAYSDKQILLKNFKDQVHTELHQQTEFDLLKAKYSNVTFSENQLNSDVTTTLVRTQLLMRRKMVTNCLLYSDYVFLIII